MTMIYNPGNRVVNNYLVSLGEEDGYVLTHGKVKKSPPAYANRLV